jgi:hypothetical protein
LRELEDAVRARDAQAVALHAAAVQRETEMATLQRMNDELLASRSWRNTKPLVG